MFDNLSSEEKILQWIDDMSSECSVSYPMLQDLYDGNTKPVAVDIGANVGGFCLNRNKMFENIYAFEPYKPNVQVIQIGMKFLNINNVKVFHQAVHSKSGERLSLKSPNLKCSGDVTCVEREGLEDLGETCTTISLQHLIDSLKIDKIDYLKMDCEGSEYDILENFKNMKKIDILCIEIHDIYGFERKASLIKKIEKTHTILTPMSMENPDIGYKIGWGLFPVTKTYDSDIELLKKWMSRVHNILCVNEENIDLDMFPPDMIIKRSLNDT